MILQQDIFGGIHAETPKTEGIKYAGSKLKILPYIIDSISDLPVNTILDGFSGTTRVSQALAQLGYTVTSSDISAWSEVFATCYLKSKKPDIFYQKILDTLNALPGYNGWYTKYYGADVHETKKRPFQKKNTQKLDAIRDEIEKMELEWEDKCVILTSLIYALDCVDNTLGHYVAYLSKWSPRSYNNLFLKLPKRFPHNKTHSVVRGDIFKTISSVQCDLAYFDPPYGSNNEKMPPSRVRYASYYHIWTTLIQNDKPAVFGKVNRREDSRDQVAGSVFEEFRKDGNGSFLAMNALRKLVQETKSRYILLSYSSGGRATKKELHEIIDESGTLLKALEIDYKKNVMSTMRWTNEWINSDEKYHEYLFLMEKHSNPIQKPSQTPGIKKFVYQKNEQFAVTIP